MNSMNSKNQCTDMDAHIKERIKAIGGEAVSFDVSMAQHTTLRVGGNAEVMYKAKNLRELKEMIAFFMGERVPYVVVGRGSNLLVTNGGFSGVVILLDGCFTSLESNTMGEPYVKAGAGLPLNTLVDFCLESGLAGVEFLAGIPGTLGGAVTMNAGSWGEEMKDIVGEVTFLTTEGLVEKKQRNDLKFGYRGLDYHPGYIILNARLNLRFYEPASIKKRVIENLKKRRERQPHDMPSAGSVFKNPEGDYAGRLIEAAGLKGRRVGGAIISQKHANFIVNTGNASASEVVKLMDLMADKVREKFNVELIPEIKVIGTPHERLKRQH
jgi:UDP-N-acetylmuramate dehydrogenase